MDVFEETKSKVFVELIRTKVRILAVKVEDGRMTTEGALYEAVQLGMDKARDILREDIKK